MAKLQIHTALHFGVPTEDILELLNANPDCAAVLDVNGKLPIQVAMDKKRDIAVISRLLLYSLPFTTRGDIKDFPGGPNMWIHVLTDTNDEYVEAVDYVLSQFLKESHDSIEAVDHIKLLAECRDRLGRSALDVSTPKCKHAIMSSMLFNSRYELKNRHPEHQSATCVLHLAEDHNENHQLVALKIMRNKDQFYR